MLTLEQRTCLVCDGRAKTTLHQQQLVCPDKGCTYSGYDVVACRDCGFVYAAETLGQHELDAHYRGDAYKVANETEVTGEPEVDKTRLRVTCDYLLPHLNKGANILDVGCGTGFLLGLLRAKGWEDGTGIDQSEAVVQYGRERHGLELEVGSIYDFTGGPFDLVTACHILEHLSDVSAFLRRLRQLLTPSGLLYIEVPNAGDFERFADPVAVHDSPFIRDLFTHFTPEHINFFSAASLRNLMGHFGFVEADCTEMPSGVLASLWRKGPGSAKRAELIKDVETPEAIVRYARLTQAIQSQAVAAIRGIASSGREVFVWGAGLHTQRLLANGELAEVNIRAFVDSDPIYRGGLLFGRRILTPPQINEELPILISSYRAEQTITAAARHMGLTNELLTLYSS